MSILLDERIKFFSLRWVWICLGVTTLLVVGVTWLLALVPTDGAISVVATQYGPALGSVIVMLMSAVSVTGEYRFGTIRPTLLAAPDRTRIVLRKGAFLFVLATILGLVYGFGAYGLVGLLADAPVAALDSADAWRQVAGNGLVFGLSALIGVAVGFLTRSAAAAITGLLLWSLVVESAILLAGEVGAAIREWMPFVALARAVEESGGDRPYGPGFAFVYVTLITGALLAAAAVVVERRDA